MDLSDAASELYGVAPEDFVETRKRLAAEAKKAGDADLAKRVGALRRPTVSAWAVNRLARAAPDELGELLDLGADLRSAWETGGQLGEFDQRRGELVARLARTAHALAQDAGRPLREAAAREVEETLHAATMDPAVAEEVRSGRLAQPRSHVGFGPAGSLSGLTAPPSGGSAPAAGTGRPADGRRAGRRPAGERRQAGGEKQPRDVAKEREEARRREEEERRRRLEERAASAAAQAVEAERALAEWESEAGEAERARAAAGEETERLREEVERLRRELNAAQERQEGAAKRLRVAERERDHAARRAAEARRRSDEARSRL
ncbi:hypothetical protein [Sphaerisporangium perillae]|uniref:hypothetical protein n=1 Tax=Sphaerisporangium perillae TaxID=2935860 RepID=UPI00200BB871|nr:hypothetical protein [Sphaerisporangium perillae]